MESFHALAIVESVAVSLRLGSPRHDIVLQSRQMFQLEDLHALASAEFVFLCRCVPHSLPWHAGHQQREHLRALGAAVAADQPARPLAAAARQPQPALPGPLPGRVSHHHQQAGPGAQGQHRQPPGLPQVQEGEACCCAVLSLISVDDEGVEACVRLWNHLQTRWCTVTACVRFRKVRGSQCQEHSPDGHCHRVRQASGFRGRLGETAGIATHLLSSYVQPCGRQACRSETSDVDLLAASTTMTDGHTQTDGHARPGGYASRHRITKHAATR